MSQAIPSATARSPMAKQPRSRIPGSLSRTLLGLVLLFGAYTKFHFNGGWHFQDYYFFLAMAMGSYRLFPLGDVEWVARILPWAQLTLGGLLIVGAGMRWAALISSALLLFMALMPRTAFLGLANRTNLAMELLVNTGFFFVALNIALGAFRLHRASQHQT